MMTTGTQQKQTGWAVTQIGQPARKDANMASTLPIFTVSEIIDQGIRSYRDSLIAARRWLKEEGASGLTFRAIRNNGLVVETTLGPLGGIQKQISVGRTS